jgi:peptidoglycan/LPS O-acetylase OafA/YrhL
VRIDRLETEPGSMPLTISDLAPAPSGRRRSSRLLLRWRGLVERHGLTTGRDGGRDLRVNNFDALRLLAALAVLVSHAFALAGHGQPMIGSAELGETAVWVFFGISGFLIAQSWVLEPRLWHYLAKRALRILPALIVVVLLTVLVLGAVATSLSTSDYYSRWATWAYALKNSLLVQTSTLPGVFTDNPYPQQVNGSLWTLAPESWAYLGIAALGLVHGLRYRWLPPLVAVALMAWPHDPTGLLEFPKHVWMLQAFAVGTSLYVWRDHLPWHGAIAAVLVGAFALAPGYSAQVALAVIAVPYAAIYLAYRAPAFLRGITDRGDFSYGIYLYAWPVGQAVVALWPGVGSWGLIAVSLPITCVLAVASWHVVERPALALKRRLPGARRDPRAGHTLLADPAPAG